MSGDGFHGLAAIAPHRVDVMHASEGGCGCVDLIPVMHVEGNQHLLHRCHRHVAFNSILTEPRQRHPSDFHHAIQLDSRIGAVGPLIHLGVRADILVRHVPDVPVPRVVENFL